MTDRRNSRIIRFSCCLALLALVIGGLLIHERQHCLNVPIISADSVSRYDQTDSLDISQILFEGQPVPTDLTRNTIYISQPAALLHSYTALHGSMSSASPDCSLFFVDDPAMVNLAQSVRDGRPLPLIMVCGTEYKPVNVLITTLPVLSMKERVPGSGLGSFTLFGCFDPQRDVYSVRTEAVRWNARGHSSQSFPKKGWKLNVREGYQDKKNVSLLDLGSDDDWILNPMSMDDTKLKEMLVQTVWNRLTAQTGYNLPMTTGRYVEVVINNTYHGLYLLQRRVDEKYLGLDKETDLLFKGQNTWTPETLKDGYRLKHSPLLTFQSYDELERILSGQNPEEMDTENVIDVTLLLQLISGQDNTGYKNMFYAIRRSGGRSLLTLVPWDTDLSLGVTWDYNYDASMNQMPERQEMATIRLHTPDVDERMAARWQTLRGDVFSGQYLMSVLDELSSALAASGAVQRDQEVWGLLHKGSDNTENLMRFISERLIMLDQYYAGLAG